MVLLVHKMLVQVVVEVARLLPLTQQIPVEQTARWLAAVRFDNPLSSPASAFSISRTCSASS